MSKLFFSDSIYFPSLFLGSSSLNELMMNDEFVNDELPEEEEAREGKRVLGRTEMLSQICRRQAWSRAFSECSAQVQTLNSGQNAGDSGARQKFSENKSISCRCLQMFAKFAFLIGLPFRCADRKANRAGDFALSGAPI